MTFFIQMTIIYVAYSKVTFSLEILNTRFLHIQCVTPRGYCCSLNQVSNTLSKEEPLPGVPLVVIRSSFPNSFLIISYNFEEGCPKLIWLSFTVAEFIIIIF